MSAPRVTSRPCKTDPEAFFPVAGRAAAVRAAQDMCRSCPFLGQCASDAVPMVRDRLMAGGVVAAVLVPSETACRKQETRERVIEQLLEVAAAVEKQRAREAA
ncbi:WhiB family transcriptional regulator [Nocardia sp. NPDC051756]|uniref:WhiB family transcriptional regulator n=1 Tax=Nocardia sp. NPDC051756 TaxID=3154751 RepID=UPI00341CBA91